VLRAETKDGSQRLQLSANKETLNKHRPKLIQHRSNSQHSTPSSTASKPQIPSSNVGETTDFTDPAERGAGLRAVPTGSDFERPRKVLERSTTVAMGPAQRPALNCGLLLVKTRRRLHPYPFMICVIGEICGSKKGPTHTEADRAQGKRQECLTQPSARALASASMRALMRSSSTFTWAFTAGSSSALFTSACPKM